MNNQANPDSAFSGVRVEPREVVRLRFLAADCRFFADSADRQGTSWAQGCAKVLRLAADELDTVLAAGGEPINADAILKHEVREAWKRSDEDHEQERQELVNELDAAKRRNQTDSAALEQLRGAVDGYLAHLHSSKPLGEEFGLWKQRVINAACCVVRPDTPKIGEQLGSST